MRDRARASKAACQVPGKAPIAPLISPDLPVSFIGPASTLKMLLQPAMPE